MPATPISFHDSERFNPVIKDLSPRLALSDGFAIPQLGLGVYKVEDREARDIESTVTVPVLTMEHVAKSFGGLWR